MSRNSLQDQTNIPLIVTTNDNDTGTVRSSMGTSLDSCSFKAKSCRSFVRPTKLNSEHRNKSVPHNLQVPFKFIMTSSITINSLPYHDSYICIN